MADDWESLADDATPVTLPAKSINVNKWQGEDEEEDVKDSWEDDEEEEAEEKKDDEKAPVVKSKPKRSLKQIIAEKEAAREAELEAKALELEAQLSDEDKAAEKLRLQKVQEEADLRAAMDTFGVSENDLVGGAGGVLDNAQPTNADELREFKDNLAKKITAFKSVAGYAGFVEELVQSLGVTLVSTDLQKIKKTVDNLYTEKQKMEKEKIKGKGAKGKAKASLRMDGGKTAVAAFDTYDYDDFM